MAHKQGASLAGTAAAALLGRRTVGVLQAFDVSSASLRAGPALPNFPLPSSRPLPFSRSSLFLSNSCNSARYNSGAGRAFGSTAAPPLPSRMLVDNPRPTQYQTEICNEAVNPKPGVETSFIKPVLVLTGVLIVAPLILTKYELDQYYKELGPLYKTGWNRYHYHDGKKHISHLGLGGYCIPIGICLQPVLGPVATTVRGRSSCSPPVAADLQRPLPAEIEAPGVLFAAPLRRDVA